jgi:hypothetical protein
LGVNLYRLLRQLVHGLAEENLLAFFGDGGTAAKGFRRAHMRAPFLAALYGQ